MKVRLTGVPFETLPYSKLFCDCTKGHFPEHFLPIISSASLFSRVSAHRQVCVPEALLRAYNTGALMPAQEDSIDALKNGNALAVVTGQQVSVFGGPSYVLLKAITAVVYAKRWQKMLRRPVVPVFWLADEDHDLAEVSSLQYPTSGGTWESATISTEGTPGGAVSTFLPDAHQSARLADQLAMFARNLEDAAWMRSEAPPRAGETLAQWFRRLLNYILGSHGLVFMGSNHPLVKKQISGLMENAFRFEPDLMKAVEERSLQLEQSFHRQATVGKNLFFYFDASGRRIRLEPGVDNTHSAGETTLPDHVWLDQIRTTPERFSPNVFLRPVLQDALLPTLAYVGGPGEIAYHAQLRPLYSLLDVDAPFLLPRFCATFADRSDEKTIADNHLSFQDLRERTDVLEKRLIEMSGKNTLEPVDAARRELESVFQQLSAVVKPIDATLAPASERIAAQTAAELDKLYQKLIRTLKQREETRLSRVRKSKNQLFPRGELQERVYPWLWLLAKYGRALPDRLIEALSDFAGDAHVIVIPEFESST